MHIFEQKILYYKNLKCLQNVENFNFYNIFTNFVECFVYFDNNANKKFEMFYIKIEIENEMKIINKSKKSQNLKNQKM